MAEILVLGVLISIVFYELTDLSPGGIIVPGLMVLYISNPWRMFYTLAVAIGAYYIVKLLSLRFIIFGKRRFALLIVFSFLLYVFISAFGGGLVHGFSWRVIWIIG